MTSRSFIIGRFGPFEFDDEEVIDNENSEFDGEARIGLLTSAPIRTTHVPLADEDVIRVTDLNISLESLETSLTEDYKRYSYMTGGS